MRDRTLGKKAYDIVTEYYLKYGKDTAGCASEFLENIQGKIRTERSIKKIAIYYPVMNRGGVQRVISLLFPIYRSLQCETILITEKISDEDYCVPEWVKRFTITGESEAVNKEGSFMKRCTELAGILETENVDLFLHHGVRQTLFVYDIMQANVMGIYTAAVKHQVFTQGFCDINDLFWTHLPAFQILDGLVVLSHSEVTYWKTFGINAIYIENPFNEELRSVCFNTPKDSISWAGRLDVHSKQYFDVLKIAALVVEKHPETKIRMYGSGSQAKINELNQCIKEHGLENNVSFCGYEADIADIYKSARIQLVTSAYECFPMTVYESKILGIPLVMYELPYLELTKNRLGCILVPVGDISAAAEGICAILDNPELEKRLGDEAVQSVQNFSSQKTAQKWECLFRNMETHTNKIEKNTDYELILKTMHRHYAVAQEKYAKLLWTSEQAAVFYHVRKAVCEGKEIVICLYGKVGKRVKTMLNEKGICEAHILDNGLAEDCPDILSMDDLKKLDCSNYFFIICCEDDDLKSEFKNRLCEVTHNGNIIYYDAEMD